MSLTSFNMNDDWHNTFGQRNRLAPRTLYSLSGRSWFSLYLNVPQTEKTVTKSRATEHNFSLSGIANNLPFCGGGRMHQCSVRSARKCNTFSA